MKLFEFHCRKCKTYVEYGEKIPRCPNCNSDDIKVTYYDELTIKNFIWKLADIENRITAIEEHLREGEPRSNDS